MDEIEAANPFIMLLMSHNGVKLSIKSNKKTVKNKGRPSASKGPQGWPQGSKQKIEKR